MTTARGSPSRRLEGMGRSLRRRCCVLILFTRRPSMHSCPPRSAEDLVLESLGITKPCGIPAMYPHPGHHLPTRREPRHDGADVQPIASRLLEMLMADPRVLCGRADRLGKVFFPVKSDVGGNVDKLKKALAAAPAETLQALILAEKATGKHKDKNSAACALLWFKRCQRRASPAHPHSYARCVCHSAVSMMLPVTGSTQSRAQYGLVLSAPLPGLQPRYQAWL